MFAWLLTPLISGLSILEKDPVWDTAVRDTLGNSVPKTALTRTKDERIDVAVSQGGNTVAFVGGGLAVDKLLQLVFSGVQKAGKEASNPYRWAVMARSIGVYSTMASTMWAMPFIRNYITTKRSGTVNYSDVIKSGGAPKGPKTPEQQAAVDASLKDSQKKALTILGAGAVGIVAPAILGRAAASSETFGKGFLNWATTNSLAKKFMLEGGKFSKMGGLPSMMFWGIPAYIGWYHASRDPYEKKEVFVRCLNFLACFSIPPALMKKVFHEKFKQFDKLKGDISFTAIQKAYENDKLKREAAQKLLVTQNALGIISSIVLLGVSPQVLNIFLTNRRLQQEEMKKKALKEKAVSSVAPQPAPLSLPAQPMSNLNPDPGAPSLAVTSMAFSPSLMPIDAPLVLYPQAPEVFNPMMPSTPTVQPTPQPFVPVSNRYPASFPTVGLGTRSAFG